ncbi:MAG: transporter substrate-binding domain-containing protein [Bacteroidales bacterium]|nr:transporter substrate-binding domain-containing protein [Bacteroidales bacterium]
MKFRKLLFKYLIASIVLSSFSLSISGQDSLPPLKVGADYAYYPYEFVNEIHQADGFDIDIIKAIGKELNRNIDIHSGNWFSIKSDIEKGNLDILAGMYYLPDRAEKVNFSMPYIIITHSIFVKKGDYWQSLKDVKDNPNLKVVVENSSILHSYLTTAGITTNRILPVENQLDALKILSETPNTCALLPDLQGKYIASKNGYDDIVTVGLPILPREYSIAVNKSDTLLLNQINDAITKINKNGTYKKIYNKWFGQYNEKDTSLIKLTRLEVILLILLFIPSLFLSYSLFQTKKVLKQKDGNLNSLSFENQKLNDDLTKKETTLRKITENTPYSISIINAKSEFIYVNRKFEDEFGYTRQDIHNLEQWFNLFFPDRNYLKSVKLKLEEDIIQIINNQDHKTHATNIYTLTTRKKEDKKFIIQIISLGEGELLFFFENITERVHDENRQKEARQKAESADKMKSSFLANISHEIRTPMNSILGFSSLLAEDNVEKDDKDTYIKLIRKNGNVLLLLIQDIIDISKIEAGELRIYPQIIDIHDTILDSFHAIQEDFKVKIPSPINFKLKLPANIEHTKYFVRVDTNRLSQVLNNLLNNSFKYTDKGEIEYGFYDLGNNTIRIYVKDTGIGIKKEELLFLFNRFTRVDEENAFIRGGTGLGLSIAYQILKLFGSELLVDSHESKGSTFYFDLNYYESQGEKVDTKLPIFITKTATDYYWGNKTIHIIEDNQENANFLTAAMKKTNCKIIVDRNGKDAINTINGDQHIDIVLLDWVLPEISGQEISEIIKTKYPKTPIIVITAMAMVDDKFSILEKDVDAYFSKPVDKIELLEKINEFFIKADI